MPLDIEGILSEIGIVVTSEDSAESWAKCPMHEARTGKEDSHPSWSMNADTFAHHCFSCGYSGNLVTLYRDVTGAVPDDLEWEIAKQSVTTSLGKPQAQVEVEGPVISEWSLRQYGDMPERLLERRYLHRDAIDHYGVRWDTDTRCWVLPIRTPDGDLLGYQFRQKGIVLNYPEGMKKSETLFGIHLFKDVPKVTLVESPLDAVRFWGLGIPSVASFGAAVSDHQIDILARNYRSVVVAMDNDSPGKRSTQHIVAKLRSRGCTPIEFLYADLAAKDPGDVESDEELRIAWSVSNSFNLLNTGAPWNPSV